MRRGAENLFLSCTLPRFSHSICVRYGAAKAAPFQNFIRYTLLNNDQAARFTSTSSRVNSWASPEKQRAMSV